MKMKKIIGALTAKFAVALMAFGLAGGAWAADPVTIQNERGQDISVYEVSSGFYQSGATYATSADFYITSKAGLEYFRDLVNGDETVCAGYPELPTNRTTHAFIGKTVHLLVDIDLANKPWEPIGYAYQTNERWQFEGSFDGGIYDELGNLTGTHKISNLNVSIASGKYYAGLFGVYNASANSTLKNLTLDGVTISSGQSAQGVGAFVGSAKNAQAGVTLENLHVIGNVSIVATISYVGGIVGDGRCTIRNCSVATDGTIKGSYNVGGIAGGLLTRSTGMYGCAVTNATVQTSSYNYGLGALAGFSRALNVSNCTASAATVKCEVSSYAGQGMVGLLVGFADSTTAYTILSDNTVINTTATEYNTAVTTHIGALNADYTIVGANIAYDGSGKINGGVFQSIPAAVIADGLTRIPNTDQATSAEYPYTVGIPQVAQIGAAKYASLEEAIAAAQSGETIVLLADIEVSSKVSLDKTGTYTIDGDGRTISMKSGATFTGEGALIFGPAGTTTGNIADIPNKTYTLQNVTITGFDAEILRIEGCGLTLDNVTFDHNNIAKSLGRGYHLVRVANANVAIQNSTFSNNAITGTTDGRGIYVDETSQFTLSNSLFDSNTVNGSGVVTISNGSNHSVINNTFEDNTVTSQGNGAVLYLSKTATVTGNLFKENSVTEGTASGKEGVIVVGSGGVNSVINNNAFVDNTLGTTTSHYATIYTGANCNLAGNYWGEGATPEVKDHADVYASGEFAIDTSTFASAYAVNDDGCGVTVTLYVPPVAQIGETKYTTLAAAIAAAQAGDTIEVFEGTVEISNNVVIPQGVTIKGEGAEKTAVVIASASGDGVKVTNPNVTISNMTIDGSAITSVGYNSIINVKADGVVVDGVVMKNGGKSTWNSSILVEQIGSSATFTVKNSTISGSFRGVLRESCNANIVIDNCDIDAVYPFNIDGGNGGTVTVKDSSLHGWTSYSGIDSATFTNCEFSKAKSGYDVVAAYVNTTFTDCEFDSSFDIYAQTSPFTFSIIDCTKDETVLTWSNFKEKFPNDPDVWNKCTCLVNGINVNSVAVAQIGNVKYGSLAGAIAAVPTDGTETTITMIADSAETALITVAAAQNVVLDLNGKTVSYTTDAKSVYFLTNKGTLTVKDTSTNADGQILLTAQPDTGYSVECVTVYNLGGTLTLESGTIKNATGGGLAYAVNNSSNAWGAGDDKVSTFNMTGGTVSAPGGDAALRVYQNCAAHVAPVSKNYVNISGGTIVDTGIFVDTVLYTDSGIQEGFADSIDTKINISGGTVNGLVDMKIRHKNNTKLNITGGDFTNAKLWVRKVASEYKGDEPTEPMVSISGGKFAFVTGKAFGLAYDCGATSWTSYEKPYSVSGGVFNVDLNDYNTIVFDEGKTGVANTDAETKDVYPYTVGVAFVPVAQIVRNDMVVAKYETLADAITAAQAGDTVELLDNVTTSDIVFIDKSITLDGKGRSLITCASRAIRVNNGNVDVKVKNLTIPANTNVERAIQVDSDKDNVTLTIDNVMATATMYTVNVCIDVDNLNLTVTNSVINGWGAVNLWGNSGTVRVADSTLNSVNDKGYNAEGWNDFGAIIVEGDTTGLTDEHASAYNITVVDTTITASSTTGNHQYVVLYNDQSVSNAITLEGCSITLGENGLFFLDQGDECVTKVKETYLAGTEDRPALPAGYTYAPCGDDYYLISKAVAQIGETGYVTLDAAIDAAQVGDTVTLLSNLELTQMLIIPNGKNFTLDLNGKEITASEDTWTAGDMLICVSYGATLTIDNSLEPTGGFIFADTNDSVLGAIKMTNKGDDPENGIATLIVKAGWIEGNYYGISGNGTRQGTYVRIESGCVCAAHETEGIGIYQPQNGTLIITGDAMVDGMAAAVYVKSGYVEVSDEALLSCEGEAGEYSPSGDGANPTGDVLVIDNCGYPGGAPTASITGGLFDSLNGKAVASYASAGNEPVVGFVSGGIFSSEIPQEYCADGYIPGGLDDEWNMYVVKEGGYVAKILGGLKYEALTEAVAAVQNGQTIVLLSDVTLDAPMDVVLDEKVVTLDLGGKTLTGRTNLKSGSLTVQNGTVAGGNQQALNVYGSATPAQNYSVLTIAATAKVTADVYGVCLFGPTYSSANGYGAVINIAGTVETTGDAESGAVFVSGNLGNYVECDANNIINVTGSITSATDAAIALNGLATVNVLEGAEVVGNTAIAVKRGTLNVTGGTIRATGAKNYPPYVNNNGTEMTGAAISISDTYSKYGALAVAVSGGIVKSSNADALYMKDATYQSDASLVVSGGYFSTKVPDKYCDEGLVPTTKPAANGLYTVVAPATVTYTLAGTEDDPATAALPDPASFTYPSGDLAEIALAVATCTDNDYTFGGWQIGGTTKVVSALPAGTKGNVTLVATWTRATKIEVATDSTKPEETVEVKVTDEWVAANVTKAGATATAQEIKTALEATKTNGLTGLENYVLGLDGKDPNAKVVVESEQGASETAMPVKNTLAEKVQTADTGFTVKYSLDKVSSSQSSATVEQKGQEQDTSDLELNLKEATSGDSNVAYYKMTATIQKTTGETVSTVHSENTIGVLAVTNAPATAIIGVPWSSSTNSNSISVNDLVRTANLTPGDELKVFDPATKTYKMWNLNNDKEWEPVETSSGSGTSDPGEATDSSVARGAGVWLTRKNPDEPIYLVGQAEAAPSETAIDKPTMEEAAAGEKVWNLVASPKVTPVVASAILAEKSHNDKVIIPSRGSPKNIYWNAKKNTWGYVDYETDPETGYSVPVFVKAAETEIPAGTGFWYLNGDAAADKAKITW